MEMEQRGEFPGLECKIKTWVERQVFKLVAGGWGHHGSGWGQFGSY